MSVVVARLVADLAGTRVRARGRARRARRHARARLAARVQAVVGAVLVLSVTSSVAAYAADGAAPVGNPFLDAFLVKDSRGISISQYELSIGGDAGFNPVAGAIQGTAGFLLGMGWDIYRMCVAVSLWLFDFALQFKLLDVFRPLAAQIATVLATTIGKVGIVAGLTVVGFIFGVVAINKGRTALGIAEIFMVILFSWAVTSPLANPVTMIAGGGGTDGWLRNAADSGIALSSQITSGGQNTTTDPEALKAQTSGQLVDIFVRAPHQLINYGAVLDKDSKCVAVYDQVLKAGPYGTEPTARDKVGACNEGYKKAADSPQQGLLGLFTVGLSSPVLILLVVVLAVGLTLLTMLALFEASTFVVRLLKGIIPGASRTEAVEAIGVVLVVCITIVANLFAIGVFNAAMKALFSADTGWNALQIFMVLDLVLVVALIYLTSSFIKARKAGKKWGQRAGAGLSPSAQSANDPARVNPVGVAARAVTEHARAKYLATRGAETAVTAAGIGAGAREGVDQARQAQAHPAMRAAVGATKITGTAAKVALQSTIGAPVYVPRAVGVAKKATAARKAAMAAKLEHAKVSAYVKYDDTKKDAKAFGKEYAHNVGATARTVSRVSGAAKLAQVAVGMGAGPAAAGALAGAAYFAQTQPSKKTKQDTRQVRADTRPAPRNPVAPRVPATPVRQTQPTPRHGQSPDRQAATTAPSRPAGTSAGPATPTPSPNGGQHRQRPLHPSATSTRSQADIESSNKAFLNQLRERTATRPRPSRIGDPR